MPPWPPRCTSKVRGACRARRPPVVAALTLAAASTLVSASAQAQTNERIFENLQFRFVTPGARAVGMGITFVGLADDATAAASNPAGLSNLVRPEFSFELTRADVKDTRLSSANDQSIYPPVDQYLRFGTPIVLPSFGSFAIPVGDVTLATFMNTEQQSSEDFQVGGRCYRFAANVAGAKCTGLEDAYYGNLDLAVHNYGVGAAWAARRWLSVGGSVVISRVQLESLYSSDKPGTSARHYTTVNDRAATETVFLGVLVKPLPLTSVGVAYYGGSTFHLKEHVFGKYGYLGVDKGFDEDVPIDYVVPTRLSVGAAVKPSRHLTLLGEVAHVEYSSLVTPKFQVIDFMDPNNHLSPANYFYRNAIEYHAGLEYKGHLGGSVVAVRGGVFTDPTHSLHFVATPGVDPTTSAAEDFQFNATPDRTLKGGALGFGFTLRNQVQFDIAFSFVKDADNIVLSSVIRLK
jgi:long-chain fatty acid transport protein